MHQYAVLSDISLLVVQCRSISGGCIGKKMGKPPKRLPRAAASPEILPPTFKATTFTMVDYSKWVCRMAPLKFPS